ncbi:MAG: nucleotide sugar dehydrogenase [Methyloceanibacter sp.]
MNKPVVGFAGMTHLGINSAAAAAGRGFEAICFDTDGAVVTRLKSGTLPVVEPGLPELLEQHRQRIAYTAEVGELRRCGVVYIAADVPTDDQGQSDLSGIRALVDTVAGRLGHDAILVILCQVPPGFTRSLSLPKERLFYQVETLVFGRAVERAMNPERFIVGCAAPEQPLPETYRIFLSAFGCPILPMRYEGAELAKISINMFLVASISTANTIAELCEKIGADWAEIVPALKLDKRIGQHAYLAPGLGIAGGNLERDLSTVCRLARAHGTDAGVVRAWIANSQHRRDWVLTHVHERVIAHKPDPTLAVLGLAYKQDTSSTKNSPSLALLAALTPFAVRVYDPVVAPRNEFHPRLVSAASALDACVGADAVVIMTPWGEFHELRPEAIAERLQGRVVIDPYAVLNAGACRAAGLDYVTLGSPLSVVDGGSRQTPC